MLLFPAVTPASFVMLRLVRSEAPLNERGLSALLSERARCLSVIIDAGALPFRAVLT
jgi:hypothetical protein